MLICVTGRTEIDKDISSEHTQKAKVFTPNLGLDHGGGGGGGGLPGLDCICSTQLTSFFPLSLSSQLQCDK